ncbi:MAG: hypothetical protein CMI08_04295 [Oceanospirillaceae bacterium]|uniref:DUF962 domain-containing protein n=1 Tax=unclassified Thalassolituus TaxID=2624967 RepID=UPI000C0A7441|nr:MULTISPECIES: DUF962 domain-containing protein [unclassified Thalassolituus]MAK90816.1 hypothetical protein [Thalassolituus sp.]MAS24675.1 hypothetical protein [Oceanospirillaceae bacterium]MAX98415.1 hypothetical protein [Oceanospirillaceae bacterium]MBL35598.1 hypothetical protein [Oceanospirillaceae bacterium]MBS51195.1 hypothetical protein [Oceanospirillaceae bacterium]|tara:strand:- start:5043 stop:5408 length:366 start_codon:yes stop_codon:yes gene_type:complete
MQSESRQTNSPRPDHSQPFTSFAEFYPYYLSEHRNPVCRVLHYTGSLTALAVILYALFSGTLLLLPLALLAGYGPAWTGHFFFEHNRPATFKYPLWSFVGDWVMLWDFLTGRLKQKMAARP